ncbi:hypothetical protein BD779DRAFT_1678965 [Infundibulicybe gibba]|nr:hypothetical protein BD779DRAFT_1678965 [Infundibulicybe gibba]
MLHPRSDSWLLASKGIGGSEPNEQSSSRDHLFPGYGHLEAARIAVGAPECAPGFSERQWAILLFGGTICGTCGTRNAPNVIFSIRRRVCNICMKRNLVPFKSFTRKFPDYDPVIMKMAPYTQGPRAGAPLRDRICWASDLERIGKEWERLEAGIDKGVKDGEENANAYWDRMTGEAEQIMKHAIICEEWLSRVTKKEAEEKRNRRRCTIRDRLMALGYEEQDIPDHMLNDPRFYMGEVITKRLWASVRPGLVTKVESKRDSRITRERNTLRNARMNMLEPLYDAYAKSLPPREWIYLPDIHGLILHPRFHSIIYADSDANIMQSSFLPAAAELPTLVPAMISATKAALTSLLGPVEVGVDEPLDLATSVFEHNLFYYYRGQPGQDMKRLVLISWDVVAAHACKAEQHTPLQVNFLSEGSDAAAMLVRAADLDPVRATSAEMDALDLRFACCDCVAERRLKSRVGYPWKSAIEHTLTSGHMEWQKMSQEDTVRIKRAEIYNEGNERSWSCNHCTAYFKCPDTKPRVIQHLNSIHRILSPTEPSDIFWYREQGEEAPIVAPS